MGNRTTISIDKETLTYLDLVKAYIQIEKKKTMSTDEALNHILLEYAKEHHLTSIIKALEPQATKKKD